MPNLDDILAQGSKSFRQLNAGLAGSIPGVGPRTAPRKSAPVVAPISVAITKPDLGKALERDAPAPGGRAPAAPSRPHVHFYLHRVRLLDTDNKYASVKPLLDALRHSGLIRDDRDSDITLAVTQYRVGHYHQEGTGVAITYF